ncbi:hypothetical protein [Paracoccus aminovorans]|uniref:hypothetical protein n=1 Tax=Paracoccus aminovorans TaxID=34004 RepID=UPI0007839AF6|nr:hypothetical protein [Paracoccus aminovorans]MDQ7777687.1 hypothetical protein [Paracoccus aminovorans]
MTETNPTSNETSNHKENASMANNNTPTPEAASITDRDGYIVAKALAYAIARIQSLPDDRQEHGDMLDMCALLRGHDLPQSMLDMILLDVERHAQQEVDVYPGEELHDERQAMRERLDAMKAAQDEAMRRFNEIQKEVA